MLLQRCDRKGMTYYKDVCYKVVLICVGVIDRREAYNIGCIHEIVELLKFAS